MYVFMYVLRFPDFHVAPLTAYYFRHFSYYTSCPRDPTLQYLYQKSPEQKFSFQAFRFRQVPSARLYVHCEVVTVQVGDGVKIVHGP